MWWGSGQASAFHTGTEGILNMGWQRSSSVSAQLGRSSLILSQSLDQNPLQHWVSSNSQEFSFDIFQFQSQEGTKEEERQCYVISIMFVSLQGTFLKIKKNL